MIRVLAEANYRWERWRDELCLAVARRLPGRLRMWVVVDSTNTAIELYPRPDGYAGPDGVTYSMIHDGALRVRVPGRGRS